MDYILKNAKVFENDRFVRRDIAISCGRIVGVPSSLVGTDTQIVDLSGKFIFPGFADVHVHLREPGFVYKEDIASGTLAAAHGGYTTVCAMPNLFPPPDSVENLKLQLDAIEKNAVIEVLPYGTITVGENGNILSDMEGMAPYVCGFSDDGKGVQNEKMMLLAMNKAKSLGKIIAAHCEDNSLLNGGYIHDGEYAKVNGHKGICSESEWGPIKRDVGILKYIGAAYHVCHISAKESVDIIRNAKKNGLNITCETGPHYLVLSDSDLQDEGRFKMNPPLRSEEDRCALIEGIKDGTIDMIATDHAPHSIEEKSKGLSGSLMGIVGLETAFPILYTKLVLTGIISLEKLIELMSVNPRKRFGLNGGITEGERADLTVFDLDAKYNVDTESFASKGKSTPFEGMTVFGKCILTMYGGRIVWQEK